MTISASLLLPLTTQISALGSEFVHLGLCYVCSLLSLLQVMLHLPELGQVHASLLLLGLGEKTEYMYKSTATLSFSKEIRNHAQYS